jgi:uncharacterized hydrophobic protein (TIGR00271 family)
MATSGGGSSPLSFFWNKDEQGMLDMQEVVHRLIEETHIGGDFYFLLTISTLITTLGLLMGNTAVVIGGMLIAPLLSPILALGLGIVTTNRESLSRSLEAIFKSGVIVLVISLATAFLLGTDNPGNVEIMERVNASLPFMYIAILSGVAATYSWAKPKLSATLPGIAVVVALLPPLCTTGIGISLLNREIITGSLELFLVNFIGISASSAVVFSLLGFHQMQGVEMEEIMKERAEANNQDVTISNL